MCIYESYIYKGDIYTVYTYYIYTTCYILHTMCNTYYMYTHYKYIYISSMYRCVCIHTYTSYT